MAEQGINQWGKTLHMQCSLLSVKAVISHYIWRLHMHVVVETIRALEMYQTTCYKWTSIKIFGISYHHIYYEKPFYNIVTWNIIQYSDTKRAHRYHTLCLLCWEWAISFSCIFYITQPLQSITWEADITLPQWGNWNDNMVRYKMSPRTVPVQIRRKKQRIIC